MQGTMPVGALKRAIGKTIVDVRQSRFFRDRMSILLLSAALVINGLNMLVLGLHLRPTEAQVPVRYSNLTLFDANPGSLGPWYYPLLIVVFALAVTLVNCYFAYHSFVRSRLASFFLLIGSVVVAIFSFIISNAFGAIR